MDKCSSVRGPLGIDPVDTYLRFGTYAFKPELPYTPGLDGAGIVESTEEGTGERVYFGGTATGACGLRSRKAPPVTRNVSFAQAVLLGDGFLASELRHPLGARHPELP